MKFGARTLRCVSCRGYFDSFFPSKKRQPASNFVNYLQENLLDRFPGIVARRFKSWAWTFGPGIPPDARTIPSWNAIRGGGWRRVPRGPGGKIGRERSSIPERGLHSNGCNFLDDMPAELTTAQGRGNSIRHSGFARLRRMPRLCNAGSCSPYVNSTKPGFRASRGILEGPSGAAS